MDVASTSIEISMLLGTNASTSVQNELYEQTFVSKELKKKQVAAFIYVRASDSNQVVIQRSAVSKSVNLSRLRVSVLRAAASVFEPF